MTSDPSDPTQSKAKQVQQFDKTGPATKVPGKVVSDGKQNKENQNKTGTKTSASEEANQLPAREFVSEGAPKQFDFGIVRKTNSIV